MRAAIEDHVEARPAQEPTESPTGSRRMTLNMGPQHPSTHGVLRIVIELEGENIIKAEPDIVITEGGKIGEAMKGNFSMLFEQEGGDVGFGRTLVGTFAVKQSVDAGFGDP